MAKCQLTVVRNSCTTDMGVCTTALVNFRKQRLQHVSELCCDCMLKEFKPCLKVL